MTNSATYSPEDNKLRIYPVARLDSETYNRVKAAGFKWAPKQELFVAPMWTPSREDLALELCGEIGDEDTGLVDRAEQRAERFEDYSDKRAQDAERARVAVDAICEHIPLGQPILIGHHSERHARKDAERITNGMRRAVQMWKTSEYWTARAAGALRHAKYKELPAVRYRRIKGLESDLRKQQKYHDHSKAGLEAWTKCQAIEDSEKRETVALTLSGVYRMTLNRKDGDREGFDCTAYEAISKGYPNLYAARTLDEVFETAQRVFPRSMAHHQRWIEHYTNRIAYERAMLDEQGGLKGEQLNYEVGGRILRRGEWLPILKINKRGGIVQSVTVSGHFASTVSVDEIRDYRPPQDGEAEKVKAAMDKGPMCNYPGEGYAEMTEADWKRHYKDHKGTDVIKATATAGKHRRRYVDNFICANGSRQRDTLKPLAEDSGGWWEDLPAGTFAGQGTNVNTALLAIEAAPKAAEPIERAPVQTTLF